MKGVRFFFIIMLLTLISKPLRAEGITEEQASNILQSHFVRIAEIKDVYPDLPDKLPINFSEEALKRNRGAWLMPLKIDSGFEYVLFRANFENEIYSLGYQEVDTVEVKEAEKILTIINRIRPCFPDRNESATPFQYFFRTRNGNAISYDGEFAFMFVPSEVELAIMNKDSVFYLHDNELESVTSPTNLQLTKKQSIFFLTLFYPR